MAQARHPADLVDYIDKGIRCKARTKRCNKCGYRYARGDKSWLCPICGHDRRCHNPCVKGSLVCRMHGARRYAIATKADKFYVATNISRAYNRILNDPHILSLTQEIALLGTQITTLQMRIEDEDPSLSIMEIRKAIEILEQALSTGSMTSAQKALRLLYQASGRTALLINANREIREVMEVQRKLVAQEQSWFKDKDQNIPVPQVIEVLTALQRCVLKYIVNPLDRLAFLNEVRSLMPSDEEMRQAHMNAAKAKYGNGIPPSLSPPQPQA